MSKHYVVMVDACEESSDNTGSSYPIAVCDTLEEALKRAKEFDTFKHLPEEEKEHVHVMDDKVRPDEEVMLGEYRVGNFYPIICANVREIRYAYEDEYYVDYIWIVEV